MVPYGRLQCSFRQELYLRFEGFRGAGDVQIHPGVYAVVGSAAFTGGVTHTISTAVIVFELTGQLHYILPVMIAVLVANAICSYLQPSIYDSIIQIKHLPYLPNIPQTSSSSFHGIRAEQFMTPNVQYLSRDSNYHDVEEILIASPHLKAFPIVDNRRNKILIGSCSRARLLRALETQIGTEARQREAIRRVKSAIESVDRRFHTSHEGPDGGAGDKAKDEEEGRQPQTPTQPSSPNNLAVRGPADRFKVEAVGPDQPGKMLMRRNGLSDACLTARTANDVTDSGLSTFRSADDNGPTNLLSPSRLDARRRSLTTSASANDVHSTIGSGSTSGIFGV